MAGFAIVETACKFRDAIRREKASYEKSLSGLEKFSWISWQFFGHASVLHILDTCFRTQEFSWMTCFCVISFRRPSFFKVISKWVSERGGEWFQTIVKRTNSKQQNSAVGVFISLFAHETRFGLGRNGLLREIYTTCVMAATAEWFDDRHLFVYYWFAAENNQLYLTPMDLNIRCGKIIVHKNCPITNC